MLKKFHFYFLVVLLSITTPLFSNAVNLPVPTGPYPVGTLIYHWMDSSRHDPLFPGEPNRYRELMAQVWYPSERTGSPVFFPYIPCFNSRDELKKQLSARDLNRAYIKEILSLQTHSVQGAGLSKARQKFPLIIFSHGNGTNRSAYTAIMEELASHGYIVFGLDHPYGAAMVIFPDGRIVTQPGDYQKLQSFAERVDMWSADQRFALNEIEKLAAGGSPFSNHIDPGCIAVVGHSLGGISAVKTCSLDQRFKAAINLDGGSGDIIEVLDYNPGRPVMLIRKAGDKPLSITDKQLAKWGMTRQYYNDLIQKAKLQKQAVYQKLKFDAWQVTIRGAAHNNFSDVRLLERDNNKINAARALSIINNYILAFLDKYLLNQQPSLLSGTIFPYPEVVVETFIAKKDN